MANEEFEAHGIRFTVKIAVNKSPPRPDPPEFCIEHFGQIIDLRPSAAEVLAAYPAKVEIDVETLVRLCLKLWKGKYIRVAEYPPGVDRKALNEIMPRVLRWARWPRDLEDALRTSRFFPDQKFDCYEGACDEAKRLEGTLVSQVAPVRLPLASCWGRFCGCSYRGVRREKDGA